MTECIRFVGLDVHKERTVVAFCDDSGRAVEYGSIATTQDAIGKLARKLGRERRLKVCYEAGPCGYGIQRWLTALEHDCVVVAPSLIPRRSGERVKTDRRDAVKLAHLLRAGELTSVWVPDAAHEAMRDLIRARGAAVRDVRRTRQQLQGFLLRHGHSYARKRWTGPHRRWMAGLSFTHVAHRVVMEDAINAIERAEQRRDALTTAIEDLVESWSLAPIVRALQAFRGIALVAAVTVISEIGDLTRFETARQFMAYLGLVPSESTSASRVRRGGITKTGNRMARTMLVEAAWTYRLPARRLRELAIREEGAPVAVREIAWKAQVRLHGRYRKMMAKGKKPTVVVTAMARELAGFVWAAGQAMASATR
jgi:transposase